MLADATHYVSDVDNVMIYITIISVVLLLGITFAMIYFAIKYSRKRNPRPENIHGNLWLEIVWVTVPTILALSMFYYGFTSFTILRRIPKDTYNIKVSGQMWKWSFTYPNGKKYDTLYVPTNKDIKLELSSVDVIHSFYIPAFRIKEDVVPGKTDYLVFNAQEPGEYVVECAEYCGMRHSYMLNKVVAIQQNDFDAWLNTPAPAAATTASSAASAAATKGGQAAGEKVDTSKGGTNAAQKPGAQFQQFGQQQDSGGASAKGAKK